MGVTGVENARLHRRIQSAEQIARLAESKVLTCAHSNSGLLIFHAVKLHLYFGLQVIYAGSLNYTGAFQAGDNSPRVPKLGSGLKLAPDDEDVCPTCLDPYADGRL